MPAAPPVTAKGLPNPFLRGPCYATGRHGACAEVLYGVVAPVQPGDPPDRIRWYRHITMRCPCRCGHPVTVPTAALPAP